MNEQAKNEYEQNQRERGEMNSEVCIRYVDEHN